MLNFKVVQTKVYIDIWRSKSVQPTEEMLRIISNFTHNIPSINRNKQETWAHHLVGILKSAFLVILYALWNSLDPVILLTPGIGSEPSKPYLDIKSKPAKSKCTYCNVDMFVCMRCFLSCKNEWNYSIPLVQTISLSVVLTCVWVSVCVWVL